MPIGLVTDVSVFGPKRGHYGVDQVGYIQALVDGSDHDAYSVAFVGWEVVRLLDEEYQMGRPCPVLQSVA